MPQIAGMAAARIALPMIAKGIGGMGGGGAQDGASKQLLNGLLAKLQMLLMPGAGK